MKWSDDYRGDRGPRRIKDPLGPACSSHKRVLGDNWLQRHHRRLEAAMESLGELGRAAAAIGIKVTLLEPGETGNGERIRFDRAEMANVRGRALAIWHPADADLVAWRPNRVVWHMHGWKEVLGKVAWLAAEQEEGLVGVGVGVGRRGGPGGPPHLGGPPHPGGPPHLGGPRCG